MSKPRDHCRFHQFLQLNFSYDSAPMQRCLSPRLPRLCFLPLLPPALLPLHPLCPRCTSRSPLPPRDVSATRCSSADPILCDPTPHTPAADQLMSCDARPATRTAATIAAAAAFAVYWRHCIAVSRLWLLAGCSCWQANGSLQPLVACGLRLLVRCSSLQANCSLQTLVACRLQ